ncbi:putative glutathione-specific gamma-glutamylcyclotransferase 2 isoform X1 [Diorhabda sublineata]|uniref:putative glutathione-specific gamma-glutamylcyclotransferase 2 isoform X1 n=1 Tax=Diorhabda sublineata TaxID=1163346 RepID=UPI0024E14CE3|nr:putative glutathione-specific gamma-glutamylcyclotransferase 2 isoform X1 [Diorhabda sublineata]
MWIFGYGSLIWKVDFPYEKKILGYIKGFNRRFYQLSTDHRGTPTNPGRVVTLIPSNESSKFYLLKVYGVAYKIRDCDIKNVVNHLDYREKGGYEKKILKFFPISEDEQPFDITIYLGDHNNENYGGPADLNDIAVQVVRSVGPSGPNIEYVCNLANSMRTFFPFVKDDHLFELEKKVLNLLEEK